MQSAEWSGKSPHDTGVSPPGSPGTPRRRRQGAGNGSGGSADGQARGQHGGLGTADLASLQTSLDVLKLDPVEMSQEQEVHGIRPDVRLQAQPGQELRHGGQ